MNLARKFKESVRPAPPTLRDVIAGVHDKLSTLQGELREAHQEIEMLREELAMSAESRAIPQAELGSLRRQVAFYCHPDRGGNGLLMRRLNVLFDFLQSGQPAPTTR